MDTYDQVTVEGENGARFTVDRTPAVDERIGKGQLTVIEKPTPKPVKKPQSKSTTE